MDEMRPTLSAAASVAVFSIATRRLLAIQRRTEPYLGLFAFPGGYLEVNHEDLSATAVRELLEETGLSVPSEALELIDVRSSPTRDPRGHVIDVGYLAVLESGPLEVANTTEGAPNWYTLSEMDRLSFAFDHREYWLKVRGHLARRFAFARSESHGG